MIIAIVVITLMCHLRGISSQTPDVNPPCMQVDFDKPVLGTEFSNCPDDSPAFVIRTYADASIEPIGDFQYHLTNEGSTISCFQTNQVYNIAKDRSEIYTQFFWESTDSSDLFEILIFDGDTGIIYPVLEVGGIESKWFIWMETQQNTIMNAKVISEECKK